MTKKVSGLADSPFFSLPTPPSTETDKKPTIEKTVYMNGRTDEQTNTRTVEQMNVRTNERLNERTVEQTNERSTVQDYRPIARKSYDIYIDQAEMIDEWAIKQQRKLGRHVTKGEVMREIIEFFFQKKKS